MANKKPITEYSGSLTLVKDGDFLYAFPITSVRRPTLSLILPDTVGMAVPYDMEIAAGLYFEIAADAVLEVT